MRCLLICLIFFTNLFSQFSSNVDYKELSRNKNSIGVNYMISMAETEWNANFVDAIDTIRFTGNYNLLKNDFNINGHYYFGEDRLTYLVGLSKTTYSSTASIDTIGVRDRFDLGEKELSATNINIGYVLDENKYGGALGFKHFSFDTGNEVNDCTVISFNGFLNNRTSSGNKYGMDLTYSLFTDDSLVYQAREYNTILPKINIRFHYTFVQEDFDVMMYSDNNIFDSGIYEDNSYLNLGVCLHKSFDNVNSELELDLGSNFTSEFKIPEIPLPYLYYSISLNNKLFSDKINLNIGWQYEMYNAILKNYDDMVEVVPDKYPNILDLEENLIMNKLYLTLDYLF
ncbi:MAG: hypothetical protein GQ534_06505 [Candidatus Delongbacteria bacterium]|nr:hypothetical protein [Candidatus Delongbacteria bacterium]